MKGHDHVTDHETDTLHSDMQYGGLDALYFLLADGHIMQDLMMYRSIFYKGSMSENDNEFIKTLGQDLSCQASNKEHYIDDPAKVIPELVSHNRIYHEGALHHQLLAWLLEHNGAQLPEILASLFTREPAHILNVFTVLHDRFVDLRVFDRLLVAALETGVHLDTMIDILRSQRASPETYRLSLAIIASIPPSVASDGDKYRDFSLSLGSSVISHLTSENASAYMSHVLDAGVKYDSLSLADLETEQACAQFIAEHSLYNINRDTVTIALWTLLEDDRPEFSELVRYP